MKKILVVEDEENIRESFLLMLSNYDVTACGSADEALKVVETQKFDLLILDVRMPGINGVEFLEIVRKDNPDIPAIICSGYSKEFIEANSALNVSGYLNKPFSRDDLYELLKEIGF